MRIVPPKDSAAGRQRQMYIVLGELLDAGLPPVHWHISDGALSAHPSACDFDDDHEKHDEERAEEILAWARYLNVDVRITKITDTTVWNVDRVLGDVAVHIYTSLPLGWPEPPSTVRLVPEPIDGFVRRSPVRRTPAGEFEAGAEVAPC